jgi:hypothetical protein
MLALALAALVSPPVVSGGEVAPAAWAALVRGQPWVCFRAAPDCWHRIPIELADEPHPEQATASELDAWPEALDEDAADEGFTWSDDPADQDDQDDPDASRLAGTRRGGLDTRRMAFAGPGRLILEDADGAAFEVTERDLQPRAVAEGTFGVHMLAPRPHHCAAQPPGLLPVLVSGAWDFVHAPCGAALRCERPAAILPRVRPFGAARFGLELARSVSRLRSTELTAAAGRPSRRRAPDLAILATVELWVDPLTAFRRGFSRRILALSTRALALPGVPEGPLASEERAALARIACGGAPS